MGLAEHTRGCEIFKMDAVSWLQASAIAWPCGSLLVLPFYSRFAACGVGSFEALSGITQRQQRCGSPDVSLLDNVQGWGCCGA